MTREELKLKVLKFDLSRGETGRDVVLGKLTPEDADKRFESDLETVMAAIDQYANQRVVDLIGRDEPEEYAVGQYTYGDTLYDSASVVFGRNELRAEQRSRNKAEKPDVTGGES